MTYEPRDGGCQAASGALFVKSKDAHFILCDVNGNISNMSQNCMRDLGLPPTIVLRSNNQNPKISLKEKDTFSRIGNSSRVRGGFK